MNTELKIWEFQKYRSNKKINYNNKEYTCILKDNELYLDKNIVDLGDTVSSNNRKYLVIDKENYENYDKFTIQKALYTIKIYIDNVLNSIDCIVSVKDNQKILYSDQINLLDGSIILTIKDTETNRKIEYDKRILLMGNAWEVIAYTREKDGLINLYLKKGLFTSDDNKELEIADYYRYNKKHNYKLTVIPTMIEVKVGESIEIKPTLTDMETVITNVVYKIENATDITSVQKSTIVALKHGQGIIKVIAKIDNIEVATCNLNVIITEAPPVKTYIISGEDVVCRNYPEEFIITDEKEVKSTDKWTFTIDKELVNIKVIDNASIELSVKGAGNVILSATNGTEIIKKEIVCKMRL